MNLRLHIIGSCKQCIIAPRCYRTNRSYTHVYHPNKLYEQNRSPFVCPSFNPIVIYAQTIERTCAEASFNSPINQNYMHPSPPHSSSPLALFFRHSRRTGNDDNIWLNVYFRLLLWADTDGLCFWGKRKVAWRWLEEEEVVWFNQWLDLNLSPHGKSNWHQKQVCKRHVLLFTARQIGSLFVIGIYSAECDEDATENWLREGVEMTNTIIETKQIIIINEDEADEYPMRLAHQLSI